MTWEPPDPQQRDRPNIFAPPPNLAHRGWLVPLVVLLTAIVVVIVLNALT